MTGVDHPRRCPACHPLTARERVPTWTSRQAAAMSERDLQATVTGICDLLHLDHWHVLTSKGMRPGWPDLVIIGPAKVIYRELKSERGSLTPDQRRVGSLLARAGCDWAVWRPRDLVSGVIPDQLKRLAAAPAGRAAS
jgi:hypothetical protein